MASCLGLYVETGLIKYAKITKDNENIKVDTCGIKAYDNFEEELSKIIEETGSQKLPISINLSEEIYNEFEVFSLLNKKDMEAAIKTEFEAVCAEKSLRENVFESRYLLARNLESKETLKTIYISASKAEIEEKNKTFEKYRLTTVTPLPIAVTGLINFTNIDDAVIVNIEENTTLTLILQGKIYSVVKLKTGMKDVYKALNEKVNSFSKVYEICRNANIYNSEGKELDDTNEYLTDIMPTLYKISEELEEVLSKVGQNISKVYITGAAATIGNIDLYFEEYNKNIKCEILKPTFFEKSSKVPNNIKDYIEANSAIACGLQALDFGLKQMNFKKTTSTFSLKDILTMEIGGKSGGGQKIDLSGTLDKTEKLLLRACVSVVIALSVYGITSYIVNNQIATKRIEMQKEIDEANSEVAAIESDIEAVRTKKSEYTKLIKNLEDMGNKITSDYQDANAIPNLLNQIMYVIPKNVQLTSVTNPSKGSIEIEAQAERYEDLGYFKANLKADSVLLNVTSDQRSENTVA